VFEITPLHAWTAGKIGVSPDALTREQIEAYQIERINRTLALIRQKSIFYRRKLAHAPESITCLQDLSAFPLTSAEELSAQPESLVCVSQDAVQRVVTLTTSGTTDAPKRIFFTTEDQELTIDFFRVGMSTFTAPGDRVMILLPYRVGSVGDLLAKGLLRLGATPICYGLVGDPAAAVDCMRRENANVLVGVPVQVLGMATLGPPGLRLKSNLLTTDHVPQAIVDRVERVWGCRVYNHYGSTEMGLGGGVECAAHAGLHLREADLYFEVVDPASGLPLPEGEMGEVVFTTLNRAGMPLLRYRTGDEGRFAPGTCTCGSPIRRIDPIRTRLAGRIESGAGQVCMADLDEAIFPIEGVLDFQARLTVVEGKYNLEISVQSMRKYPVSSEQIDTRLGQIPALSAARASGALGWTVRVEPYSPGQRSSQSKRVIQT
jgi:phenylacetate-CoA ligase